MSREKFKIVKLGEFAKDGKWSLVRRGLDLKSFGINVVEIPPGDKIPEHDEVERDQEEVFIAWRGDAVMVIDGKEYPMPEGTFARVDSEPLRYVKNTSNKTVTVLIASAPRGSGYTPLDWA